MPEISIQPFAASEKQRWDEFVRASRNGTFLFLRDYMDYHADRFVDHSLVFLDDGQWVGIMPCSLHEDTLVSHGGLTYGGIVSGRDMRVGLMLSAFEALLAHARARGVRKIVYKPVPHIYHRSPAEEDLYALFRIGAQLSRRDVSFTIAPDGWVGFSSLRKRCIAKAQKLGAEVRRSTDFAAYFQIVSDVLARRHGAKPVHTAEEMALLAGKFPENIKLFCAYHADSLLAGVLIYEADTIAHAQYIASTEAGRDAGAYDLIIQHLLGVAYPAKRYFDFGIATEDHGRVLNEGLAANKESFGARATNYDWYSIEL